MKTVSVIILAMALALSAVPMALAADSGGKPEIVAVDAIQMSGTVTALDLKAKTVTIKGEGGKTVTLNAKQARNLDQVKVGDVVTLDYVEALALFVTKPESGPAAGAGQVVALAPKGQKPGGILANVVELRAQVTAIDYKARTVTLKGPAGNERTLKIGPEAKSFAKVKKGDDVVLRYTEAVAISVKKP